MHQYSYVLKDQTLGLADFIYAPIFNPIESGRLVMIEKVIIACYITGAGITKRAMVGVRLGNVADGVLGGAGGAKFATYYPEPKAEVRSGTITTTVIAEIFQASMTVAITAAGFGGPVIQTFLDENNPIVLQENEGFGIKSVGTQDADMTMGITIFWSEKLGMKKYEIINRAPE